MNPGEFLMRPAYRIAAPIRQYDPFGVLRIGNRPIGFTVRKQRWIVFYGILPVRQVNLISTQSPAAVANCGVRISPRSSLNGSDSVENRSGVESARRRGGQGGRGAGSQGNNHSNNSHLLHGVPLSAYHDPPLERFQSALVSPRAREPACRREHLGCQRLTSSGSQRANIRSTASSGTPWSFWCLVSMWITEYRHLSLVARIM